MSGNMGPIYTCRDVDESIEGTLIINLISYYLFIAIDLIYRGGQVKRNMTEIDHCT